MKFTLAGLGIAATGAAHFVAPELFRDLTKMAFPNDTEEWIKRNGATELALGLAVALPATRKLGFAGLGAYGAWLGFNGAKSLA